MITFSVVKDKNKKLVMSIGKFIERYGTEGRCWEHLYTVVFVKIRSLSAQDAVGPHSIS